MSQLQLSPVKHLSVTSTNHSENVHYKSKSPLELVLEYLSYSAKPDVTINCRDGSVPANKLVLASISPLLCEEFRDNILDDQVIIMMPDFTVDLIEGYLKCIFHGQSLRSYKDVNDLLSSSKFNKLQVVEKEDSVLVVKKEPEFTQYNETVELEEALANDPDDDDQSIMIMIPITPNSKGSIKEEPKDPNIKYVSPVFEYFDQIPDEDPNKHVHKCTLCSKVLIYASKNAKYTKTGHMMKHLRIVHKLKMGRPRNCQNKQKRKGAEYFMEDPNDNTRSICKFCSNSFSTANMVRHLQAKHKDDVPILIRKGDCDTETKAVNDDDSIADSCEVKPIDVPNSDMLMPKETSQMEESQFLSPNKTESPGKIESKSSNPRYVSPVYEYFEDVPGGDPNRHKCTLCGKILSYSKAIGKTGHMRKHLRAVHKLDISSRPKTFKVSPNNMGKEYYEKDPEDSFRVICKICRNSYSKCNIIRHLQALHEDIVKETLTITRHQCSQCDYTSTDIQQIKLHERKHTDDRPYKCEDCGARFFTSSNLSTHIKKVNCLKLDKDRICPDCGVVFKSPLALHNHRKLSTKGSCGMEDKPFGCTICNQHFSKESRLEYHMQIHNGEMPFQCQSCGLKFKFESGVKNHKCLY